MVARNGRFPMVLHEVHAGCGRQFLLSIALAWSIAVSCVAAESWRPETDILRRAYLSSKDESGRKQVAVPSPDGRWLYTVSLRGNLDSDCYDYCVNIYAYDKIVSELRNAKRGNAGTVTPIRIARISTYRFNSVPGISETMWSGGSWSADSKYILFSAQNSYGGVGAQDITKLCKISVDDGSITIAANIQGSEGYVQVKGWSTDAATVLFSVDQPDLRKPTSAYDSIYPFLVLDENDPIFARAAKLRNQRGHSIARRMVLSRNGRKIELGSMIAAWMSPDASFVIGALGFDIRAGRPLRGEASPQPFVLVRPFGNGKQVPLVTTEGQIVVLTGGVANAGTRIEWGVDGLHALLIGAELPNVDTASSASQFVSCVFDVDLNTGICQKICKLGSSVDLRDVKWYSSRQVLDIPASGGVDGRARAFHFTQGRWIEENRAEREIAAIKESSVGTARVTVEQTEDLNTVPRIIARTGDNEIALDDIDAVTASVEIARTRQIRWRKEDGEEVFGELTLPPMPRGSGKLPLVVAFYSRDSARFAGDNGGSSLAVQSLAGRGFAVLNLDCSLFDIQREKGVGKPHGEGPEFVARLQSAIEMLVNEGTVDPLRIGIVGFSRGGYETFYAITHPGKYRLAAASITDAFLGTFTYSFATGDLLFGELYNGSFWDNKGEWLDHDPIFNVERIEAPVQWSLHGYNAGYDNAKAMFEFHAPVVQAFQAAEKPLEMLFYPRSPHELGTPTERCAGVRNLCDWMAYWLLDERPVDADRAAGWAILRKQRDEVLQSPPPPKGKWVFQPDPVQPKWRPSGEAESAAEDEANKPEAVPAGKD